MNFLIASVLWGSSYAEDYLKLCLPCYLAAGNFPSVSKKHRINYQFHCDTFAKTTLENSPLFAKLREFVTIDMNVISAEAFSGGNHHNVMNDCHQKIIVRSYEMDAAIVFLQPDTIIGADTFGNAVKYIEQGKRVVYVGCLSADADEIRAELPNMLNSEDSLSSEHGGRSLCKKFLPHLCTWNKIFFINSPVTADLPVQVTFPKDESNLLVHYISGPHGYIIYPTKKASSKYTMDCLFPYDACPDVEKIHLVQDSDECIVLEFAPLNKTPVTTFLLPMHQMQLAYYILNNCINHEREILNKPFIFHAAPLDESWDDVKSQSTEFFVKLEQTLQLPYRELMDWCKVHKYHISHYPWADEDRIRVGLPTYKEITTGILATETQSAHSEVTANPPPLSQEKSASVRQPPSAPPKPHSLSRLSQLVKTLKWILNWPKTTQRMIRQSLDILSRLEGLPSRLDEQRNTLRDLEKRINQLQAAKKDRE